MAARALLALALLALLAGCGAAPAPPAAAPAEPAFAPENPGLRKAATWRAAALARARHERAVARARASGTVAGALRYARLTGRLSPAAHARRAGEWAAARRALTRLTGTRAAELGSVTGTLATLAAEGTLTPSRIRPAFLVLRRNTRFWTRAPLPAPGARHTYGPAIFQYYPGRGLQLQPLASWGATNWLAGACLRGRCPVRRLRRAVGHLAGLAARRGRFVAWEHYFAWGGGRAPWISGMTQATAVSALSRAARALHEPRWRRLARRALGAFRTPPPLGVDGGDHFLMYSFAPGLRIFNGELQAVNGIGEAAALSRDRLAHRLFRRGERGARRMVEASDTGAWSLYSAAGRESTLAYHRLVAGFLGDLCGRTRRIVYCAASDRFARYVREPTRIAVAPLRRLHARRPATVRFAISKVSTVRVRVWSRRGVTLARDVQLPRGSHSLAWTPPRRGRFRLRIEAQGPSGPVGVEARRVAVVLPRPEHRKTDPKRPLTRRRERAKVSA